MKVPPVLSPVEGDQVIKIEWDLVNSDFFLFDESKQTVYLHPDKKESIIAGKLCPTRKVILLNFKLESILLKGEEQLQVPIFRKSDYDLNNDSGAFTYDRGDNQKLQVLSDGLQISATGKLNIAFNKPIRLIGYEH